MRAVYDVTGVEVGVCGSIPPPPINSTRPIRAAGIIMRVIVCLLQDASPRTPEGVRRLLTAPEWHTERILVKG